jgi:hypothetical protein
MLDCICLSAPFHNNHRFTTHAVQEGIELRLCLRRDAYVFLACTFPSALHTVVNGKKRLNFIQTPPEITGYRGLLVLVKGLQGKPSTRGGAILEMVISDRAR